MKLDNYDIYMNIGRGIQVSEPGIDLACIASIMSSRSDTAFGQTIWLGEVSLTGVVKNIFMLERRIAEAKKLGFQKIVIPSQYAGKIPAGVNVVRIEHITGLRKALQELE